MAICIDSSTGIRGVMSLTEQHSHQEQVFRRSDGQPLTLLDVLTMEI